MAAAFRTNTVFSQCSTENWMFLNGVIKLLPPLFLLFFRSEVIIIYFGYPVRLILFSFKLDSLIDENVIAIFVVNYALGQLCFQTSRN